MAFGDPTREGAQVIDRAQEREPQVFTLALPPMLPGPWGGHCLPLQVFETRGLNPPVFTQEEEGTGCLSETCVGATSLQIYIRICICIYIYSAYLQGLPLGKSRAGGGAWDSSRPFPSCRLPFPTTPIGPWPSVLGEGVAWRDRREAHWVANILQSGCGCKRDVRSRVGAGCEDSGKEAWCVVQG